MKPAKDNQMVFVLRRISAYATIISITFSLIIAAGWALGLPGLKGIFGVGYCLDYDLLHAWNGLQAVDMVKNEDRINLV